MNHSIKAILSAVLISLTIILVNCKGDAGDPGPAGAPGTNGTDGTDGTNGVGFSDAIAKGSITIYLDGTRPDGVAFKDTVTFPYSSNNMDYSYAYFYEPADSDVDTGIKRYAGFNGMNSNESDYAYAESEVWFRTEAATKHDTSKYFWGYFNFDVSFPAEGKYFTLQSYSNPYFDSYYNSDGSTSQDGNVTDSTFTGYKYDSVSGGLKYKVGFTMAAGDNSSGYDLKVTYVTDAVVYRSLGGEERTLGRRRTNVASANSRKSGAKAEMKSLK